jgi:hypothetical protein
MNIKEQNGGFSRRQFLKVVGGTATFAAFSGLLSGCAEVGRIVTPNGGKILQSGSFSPLAREVLQVTSDRSVYRIKDAVKFTGRLLDALGKPIKNVDIGVEDPILQMSRMVGKTDASGNFVYQINGFENAKAGMFTFRFIAGVGDRPSRNIVIAVNAIPEIWRQFVMVNKNGPDKYKVDLSVDGVSYGSRIIEPRQSGIVLWSASDKSNHNLNLVCTNMKNGKRFIITPSSQDLRTSIPSNITYPNPTYSKFNVTANNSVNNKNVKNETKSFWGTAREIYETYINQDWGLGTDVVKINTSTKQGINFDAGISGGAQCSTFLGLQASCTIGCEAGVGLELRVCAGVCIPIEPAYELGCGLRCGVSVASASCSVGATIRAQTTYK